MFSIERVVALLTPTVFAPGAVVIAKFATNNVAGSHLSAAQVMPLEIAAFTGAVGMALYWLKGRKEFVRQRRQSRSLKVRCQPGTRR